MKLPILSVYDNEGNRIPIPAVQGEKGAPGNTSSVNGIHCDENGNIRLTSDDIPYGDSGKGLTAVVEESRKGTQILPPDADLNDYREDGIYLIYDTSGIQNKPEGVTSAAPVLFRVFHNGSITVQAYLCNSASAYKRLAIRSLYIPSGGSFSSWNVLI